MPSSFGLMPFHFTVWHSE